MLTRLRDFNVLFHDNQDLPTVEKVVTRFDANDHQQLAFGAQEVSYDHAVEKSFRRPNERVQENAITREEDGKPAKIESASTAAVVERKPEDVKTAAAAAAAAGAGLVMNAVQASESEETAHDGSEQPIDRSSNIAFSHDFESERAK